MSTDRALGRSQVYWTALFLGTVFLALSPQDVRAELIKGTLLLTFVEGYDFSEGRANYGPIPDDSLEVYDLLQYVADYVDRPPPDEGIGFFAPNGIIDLGSVEMSCVDVAPEAGYRSVTGIVVGHTYCLMTREGYYVKFHTYYDPGGGVDEKYRLDYVLQLDGSRNLDHATGVGGCTWGWVKSLLWRRQVIPLKSNVGEAKDNVEQNAEGPVDGLRPISPASQK